MTFQQRQLNLLVLLLSAAIVNSATADDRRQSIFDEATRLMTSHHVPGVSLAIIEDGKLSWAEGFGVVDSSLKVRVTSGTLFQAASLSKPVTALAALSLVDRGALKLDEPVNNYLSGWKFPSNNYTRQTPVTLRHLLSHSSGATVRGFPGYSLQSQLPQLPQVLHGQFPANTSSIRVDFQPGSRFSYSGGGYCVVQLLLTETQKRPFAEVMENLVLKPLKMSSSTFEQPLGRDRQPSAARAHDTNGKPISGAWHNYPEQAAAGLWTTPTDLAAFIIAVQQAIRTNNGLIETATAKDMLTPQTSNGPGLGLFVQGNGDRQTFSHTGWNHGFRCSLWATTFTGQGVVIMTNSESGNQVHEALERWIVRHHFRPSEP